MKHASRIALATVSLTMLACVDPADRSPGLTSPDQVAADVLPEGPFVVKKYGKWTITMTDLGTLAPNAGSAAYAINNLGEIVGTATGSSGITLRPIWVNGVILDTLEGVSGRPYSWNNRREAVGPHVVNTKISCMMYWIPTGSGQLPPLPGASSCATGAYDVNEHGEMAGASQSPTPYLHTHPVTWKNGLIFRDLGMPPGANRASGSGINDAGDIVGTLTDSVAPYRQWAFLYRNGQYTRLGQLDDRFGSSAYDINNVGDILGTSGGGYPVVWKAGSLTPTRLQLDGRPVHSVWKINDSGDVVGATGTLVNDDYVAVLWRNGEYIELGPWPLGTESYAYGINNAGTIVGVSTIPTPFHFRAMMWTVTSGGTVTPPPNTTPSVTISAVSTTVRVGSPLVVSASIVDPDNGPWTYTFTWGNGKESGTWTTRGPHTHSRLYIKKTRRPLDVFVTVKDAAGATATSNVLKVTVQ